MKRRWINRGGMTLPEVLIAMVIMAMIGGVISATFFAGMRVWRRCSSQSQADPPAHLAIRRMTTELKNAYQVDSLGDTYITFTLPRQDAYGVNILPFEGAHCIKYFITDDSGVEGNTGTVLWRKDNNLLTGAVTTRRIANNVESLSFSYERTSQRLLDIYAMSITVLGREDHEVYRSQFASHVAFRN